MSKLSFLADGQKITIATDNEPFIMRDLSRNDTASRIIAIYNADPGDPDASGIGALSDTVPLGTNNAVHQGNSSEAITAGAEAIELTVVKVGAGFQVSVPAISNLDTPAKFAAVGYQDPKRTTYPNLFELAKQFAQNADLQTEVISGMTASTGLHLFIIDQNLETVSVVGNSYGSDPSLTTFATVELDDIGSIQFGE